ncbi:PIN domain-containing protein [Thermococcus sp. Bubb.Bath]|uniref:PIN domain-containing protein n=1 Tax=Thermococcus sp. Bubb.Bath TaxID=1638242 RepID=UPI00143B965E|nr:PIN domain-containing protein [Thermococcus sp. Bubb.Bath]NJF25790.1 PIN domain-containing protein [Thermococcus sp. Bubb.Bath]
MRERIVVDTNVLFSFFKRESTTRRLILCISAVSTIYAPEYLLEELRRYSKLIQKKAGISEEEFNKILDRLRKYILFVEYPSYEDWIDVAVGITPDPKDVDFVALALKFDAILWSNDKALKEIGGIKVMNTGEIISMYPDCLGFSVE